MKSNHSQGRGTRSSPFASRIFSMMSSRMRRLDMPRIPPPSAGVSAAGQAGRTQLTEREDPQRHARSCHRAWVAAVLPVVCMSRTLQKVEEVMAEEQRATVTGCRAATCVCGCIGCLSWACLQRIPSAGADHGGRGIQGPVQGLLTVHLIDACIGAYSKREG
ncbi:hypothetical protein CONLIGDRAFT_356072 [Coniochaeta ligniaria NRRL 30616]|uniref:Uncharacterized protein n=1 Tax=Coniochaeta ligniaria NRRL 30616 TaxID=1408157 RepID=A0A1J7JQM3_9PEZI|nr:hypothetical protein CONLIGDRAFT_356072 [Coniochaeta ligniaria NRRL 30616]